MINIVEKIPIICNQENFILKANLFKVDNALPGYKVFKNPAEKVCSDYGRPRNGMFIAIPPSLKDNALDLSPNFWRLQALVISFRSVKLLLINSYFPTDSMSNRADVSDLLETLHHIKHIVATAEFDHLVLAGDLNTDFIRNTLHVSTVKDFIDDT